MKFNSFVLAEDRSGAPNLDRNNQSFYIRLFESKFGLLRVSAHEDSKAIDLFLVKVDRVQIVFHFPFCNHKIFVKLLYHVCLIKSIYKVIFQRVSPYLTKNKLVFSYQSIIFIIMISNQYKKAESELYLSRRRGSAKEKSIKASQLRRELSLSNIEVNSRTQLEDSLLDEFEGGRIRKMLLKVKVERNVILFLHKMKRNAGIGCKNTIANRKQVRGFEWSKLFEILYHLVIVAHFLAIIALLLLTSWTATLVKFNDQCSRGHAALAVQTICLIVFCLQQLSNSGSHFFRKGKSLELTFENVTAQIFSYRSISNFIKIIFSILFLIFSSNRILAALFFIFLAATIFLSIPELFHLEAAYIHTERRNFMWKISKILGRNVLLIHVMATIVIAMTFLNDTMNWFIRYEIIDETWINQYISAFYWCTVIVTTIGFGDISAANPSERLIVALLALVACIMLAYNISAFSKEFGSLSENYQKIDLKFVMFYRMIRRDYKNNVDIDPQLKMRIYKFLQSLSADKRELQFIEKNDFLSKLPEKLRKDYYSNTNKHLFSSIPFINSLRIETLSALSQSFQVLFLEQNETIDSSDLDIRVLEMGEIDLTYQRQGSTVNGKAFDSLKIGKRENIGLLTSDFLCLAKQSNYALTAHKFSVVWTMTTQNFISILQNDVVDLEYYFSNLHRHCYDEDQWGIIECSRCGTKNVRIRHCAFRCPKLSYMPIRKIVVYRSFSVPEINQPRFNLSRKKDFVARISVLKYWKKFFRNNYQFERKRDEGSHIKNLLNKQTRYVFHKQKYGKKEIKKLYRHYYSDKQKNEIIHGEQYLNFEVDAPFNFEFYLPQFNPSRLVFTQVEKCEDFGGCSSIVRTLKHVKFMKGKKFTKADFIDQQQSIQFQGQVVK